MRVLAALSTATVLAGCGRSIALGPGDSQPLTPVAASPSSAGVWSSRGWHPGQMPPPPDLPTPAGWQILPARAIPGDERKPVVARWGNSDYKLSTACDALAESRRLPELIGPDIEHLRGLLAAVRLEKSVRAVKGGRVRYATSANVALWGLVTNGFNRGQPEDRPPSTTKWYSRRCYDAEGFLRYEVYFDEAGREYSWLLYVHDAGVPVAYLRVQDDVLFVATAGLYEGNRLRMVAHFGKNLRLRYVYVLFYHGDRIEYVTRLVARNRDWWLPEDGPDALRLDQIEVYGVMHVWFHEDGAVRQIWIHRHGKPYDWPRTHN